MLSVYIALFTDCNMKFSTHHFSVAWTGQSVGLTAWEAAANLSFRVYFAVHCHELRHQNQGRCVLSWVVVAGCNMELPLIIMF